MCGMDHQVDVAPAPHNVMCGQQCLGHSQPPISQLQAAANGMMSNGDRSLESAGAAGTPPPPPPGKKQPKRKKNEGCTTARFATQELEDLMDGIEQILPVGANQSEQVESGHNVHCPDRMRTLDNPRRQFNRQCKKKAPTGDPNIPSHVRKAKNGFWQLMLMKKSLQS